ncbi:DNA recombination protein RmuC [Craterilacuibacter sp. RT1T]|uniref:DNA recombination protein RmuC n=1 Tax=Craterilacuibacter sp. RT1T TaxID=2942211 RepID=UPI0020C118DF|nr:DNA recombination protein RmuC [Craterilacuibacter sp. RT1T]
MQSAVLLLAVFLGLFAGIALSLMLGRGKISAAVEQANAMSATEMALQAQQIAAQQAQLAKAQDEAEQVRLELSRVTGLLEGQLQARAQFEERARQVPALQSQLSAYEQAMANERKSCQQYAAALSAERERHAGTSARTQALQEAQAQLLQQQIETERRRDALESELATMQQALADAGASQAALQGRLETLLEVPAQLKAAVGARDDLATLQATLREELGRTKAMLASAQADSQALAERLALTQTQRDSAELARHALQSELAALKTQLEADRESAGKQLALLAEAREAMSTQFENLAQQIFEAKSQRFAEQNQQNLDTLLGPLKTQIDGFKAKVEQVYVEEGKGRSELKSQVEMLAGLNRTLSQEARNLSRALKGDNKAQGNWGELILKDLLEQLGLSAGVEFFEQASYTRDDGSRAQPDVVLRLPEGRNLVIDAKVSLVDYTRYVAAETDAERTIALAAHLASVRSHLKGLSLREYQKLHDLDAIDFVLMFLPVEPAFMLAVTQDRDLFREAWDKNVLLVSPSTLMSVVRTVSHLWRQEKRNRQTEAIVKCGTQLYESVCAFVADFDKLGTRLRQAQDSFESANRRLSHGNNNMIGKAGQLKELGISSTKQIEASHLERARLQEELARPQDAAALGTS